MAKYKVIGRARDSNRERKRVYSAFDEEEARRIAEADGFVIEQIQLVPADPPTEPQLSYAKGLGISVPHGATKDDLSDLISAKLDNDMIATDRHKAFAKRYRVEITNYTGKCALFDRILFALKEPGNEKDLLSWFIYRVYLDLVQGKKNVSIDGPDHPIIQEVVAQLAGDDSVLKSICHYKGSELIWFGECTSPDGFVKTGGSKRTIAYKKVSELLREKLNISLTTVSRSTRSQNIATSRTSYATKNAKKPKGCFSVIVIGVIVSLVMIFSFILFVK